MTYLLFVSKYVLGSVIFFFLLVFNSIVWAQQCPAPPPATPSLSAVAGPNFDQITLSWTGVAGSNGWYTIYGRPQGGNWGDPIRVPVGAGQQYSYTTDAWGILAYMQTNRTYEFYIQTSRDSNSIKQSNIASATTRDIAAPTLSAVKLNGYQVKLIWNAVEGAQAFHAYTFSTAQNQWNSLSAGHFENGVYTLTVDQYNNFGSYYVKAWRDVRDKASNVVHISMDRAQDAGETACNAKRGEPVNVTNGNMYLQQTDYSLPGIGQSIAITRTYNSSFDTIGLFGFGWSTAYDEYITLIDNYTLRFDASDGKAIYFARTNLSAAFVPSNSNFFWQVVKNTDGTFMLTFKDGRTQFFNSTGKLLWVKDRNGNQTSLTYNGSGQLTAITDVFGRVLTISPNTSNGYIEQISDSMGVIAT